jgi:hypothetical protein
MEDQSRRREIASATSWWGTLACEASWLPITEKALPVPCSRGELRYQMGVAGGLREVMSSDLRQRLER